MKRFLFLSFPTLFCLLGVVFLVSHSLRARIANLLCSFFCSRKLWWIFCRLVCVCLSGLLFLSIVKERRFFLQQAKVCKNHLFERFTPSNPCIHGEQDPVYPVVEQHELQELDSAIRISFTGDLILLRDAVENAYNANTRQYDFSPMFREVADYWKESDLSIGVFEGPMAGENQYSTSAFDDGIPLYLNFPDKFAVNIKEAGIGLVTTANNHLLDMGIDGAQRTLNMLDALHLDHVGSYRNAEDAAKIKYVYVRGKKIAVLAYTYGSNYYADDFFFRHENAHITKVLVQPDSPLLSQSLKQVQEDFARAKNGHPDAIVVLPHMGTQFLHTADAMQQYWTDVFMELGADIVFTDHSHAVQPIEWRKQGERYSLVVHCPGNFINSYVEHDGDASMIVEAYLDPETAKPIACSIIPLYSYCGAYMGSHRTWMALPLFKACTSSEWLEKLSRQDEKRISEVHKIITHSALGHELSIDQLQERYYSFPETGYKRQCVKPISVSDNRSPLLELIEQSRTVAFVGDSITEGTKNGGYGWYEPLMAAFPEKKVQKFAKGSMTSVWFRQQEKKIADLHADLYVLAYGCNDIRYRKPDSCAMDADVYIQNIDSVIHTVLQENPQAKIACIAPWQSAPHDPICSCPQQEKDRLYSTYTVALREYCTHHGYLFIDPNALINKERRARYWEYYMKDHIHPNAGEGIRLFSTAVANCF